MPHAHILIILKAKIESPRHIDEVVWAEIPCPVKYPVLNAIVLKRMIHTPCDMIRNRRVDKKRKTVNANAIFQRNLIRLQLQWEMDTRSIGGEDYFLLLATVS